MAQFDEAAICDESWLMQTGTLSGNPVAAAAGLKSLDNLRRDGQYALLRDLGERVAGMMREALDPTGIPYRIVGDATLFDIVFTKQEARDYRAVQAGDAGREALWNEAPRRRGIFKSPGKTCPSLALTEDDLAATGAALRAAAAAIVAAAETS